MEKQILYNAQMEFEHQQWKREIAFWQEEVRSFNTRFSELITRWVDKNVLEKIKEYQKEFIIHGGCIDDLNELFAKQEAQLSHQYDTGKPDSDIEIIERHFELKNRMNAERETYADLKKVVFDFLGDNL